MSDVERAASVVISPTDPDDADARYCLARYFSELNERFDTGFDPHAKAPDRAEFLSPHGCWLVARRSGEPIGCGGVRTLSAGVGEIKRMWIAPNARGLGLGRRLLAELEGEAVRIGLRCMRLDTNATLEEALRLYRSSGYREIPRFNENPYAQHWFEKTLS
jgi:ribosomal protein S18 acetylase RimI-like enzyme